MDRGLKFRIKEEEELYCPCSENVLTKALISCEVTAQLICVFVFVNANSRFSYNEAQIILVFQNIALHWHIS